MPRPPPAYWQAPDVHVFLPRAAHALLARHCELEVQPQVPPMSIAEGMHSGPGLHVVMQLLQAPPVLPHWSLPMPPTQLVPLQQPPLQMSPPVQTWEHVPALQASPTGQAEHASPLAPQVRGPVPGWQVAPSQQPPLHRKPPEQLVLHVPMRQASFAGHWSSFMQPHVPRTHSVPFWLIAQSVHCPPVFPHCVLAVPAWHVVPLQHPPLHASPPPQASEHCPVAGLHAWPTGQSEARAQPAVVASLTSMAKASVASRASVVEASVPSLASVASEGACDSCAPSIGAASVPPSQPCAHSTRSPTPVMAAQPPAATEAKSRHAPTRPSDPIPEKLPRGACAATSKEGRQSPIRATRGASAPRVQRWTMIRSTSALVLAAALLAGIGVPRTARGADPPWNEEAHADRLVGSIAASVGAVVHKIDEAQAHHDSDALQCLRAKLAELRAKEAQARQARSLLRIAWIDADDSDRAPYEALVALDASATSLRHEADVCGMDSDADGIPDLDDRAPESVDGAGDTQVDVVKRGPEREVSWASTETKAKDATTPAASPSPPAPPPPPAAVGGQVGAARAGETHDASMLIHTAELSMAVYEVRKNVEAVERSAIDLGGYLALRTDREITVRVPRERFDELVKRVERMGDVLHKNVAAEDVTDQYVDLELRLKNAVAVRDRLEKLLAGATVRDAIEIQKELAKVTGEIERLEGKLKLLRDRIAYSTVTVSFEQAQSQKVKAQALLPFPWMGTMGLSPLLQVPR